MKSPEINPCLYGQLIFDKGGMSIQWNKNSHFNKWWWENWNGTYKKIKLYHQLTPYTTINSKWMKDLNTSHDTIEILAENIGSKFQKSHVAKFFANISPRARKVKEKNKQMGLHHIKKLLRG